jgi:muramidase (phage lysozyme)
LPRSPRTTLPAAQPCLVALLLVLPLTAPRFLPEAGTMAIVPLQAASQPRASQAPAAASSLEFYQLTPERLALLSTIRFAEGTWLGGSREGYRVLYGGGRFEGFARHPEVEVRSRYVSAAAGAYQFLPQTWQAAARDLGLPDFGPASQDQAALHLVDKRGALSAFDREGLTPEVLARLAPEWASLPTLGGASAYCQPVRTTAELQGFFQRELERQRDLRAG